MGLSLNTVLVIAVIALVALVALRWTLRKSGKETIPTPPRRSSTPQRKAVSKNPFRATSISSPENACAAAKALAGKRFLVSDNNVPQLPLAECDVAHCTCTYVHHPDRRDEDADRRATSSLRTQLHSQTDNVERREKRGRRATDWLP